MTVTVGEIVTTLENAYPPALAEPWDTGIGLTCGDRAAAVETVLLAVDADAATVDEAIAVGAQLFITHHPLLFRSVQSVAADTAKGALIHRLITAGIAHYAAHTNADKAVGGVNDALAGLLGVHDAAPLEPDPAAARADSARFASGATGSGRVGKLAAPTTLQAFTALVAGRLPSTAAGVRAAGDPDRIIEKVAMCGGAGSSFLEAATLAGADVFVSSDLGHHVVAEHVADPRRPAVIEVAHWAGEWPWLTSAADVIERGSTGVSVIVSAVCTDPWTMHHTPPDDS